MTLSRLDPVFGSGERCLTPDLGAREREREGDREGSLWMIERVPRGIGPFRRREMIDARGGKGDTIVQICEPRTL